VYLFNVWDAFEHNPIAQVTHQKVAELFPADLPQFYATPYGFYRPEPIVVWLEEAGFEQIEWSRIAKTGSSPPAADAATGLIDGNPIREDIVRRRSDGVGRGQARARGAHRCAPGWSPRAGPAPGPRLHRASAVSSRPGAASCRRESPAPGRSCPCITRPPSTLSAWPVM